MLVLCIHVSHCISHGFITKTDLLLPDLDKFWRPLALGQGPPSSQSSSANFSWGIAGAPASALLPAVPRSHACPGSQGHVAEVGAATGPCPWSPVGWQMCALLGAVCNLHTELPLLLRRVALMSRAAGRAPASACLAPRVGTQALSLPTASNLCLSPTSLPFPGGLSFHQGHCTELFVQ